MRNQSAASAYKQTTYDSAPPLKIVHMMYEGALRFIGQAQAMDPAGDAKEFDQILQKAAAVIFELRVSLDHEAAPELCRDLTALYLFSEDRIRMALFDRSTEPLTAAVSTRDSFMPDYTRPGWPVSGMERQSTTR